MACAPGGSPSLPPPKPDVAQASESGIRAGLGGGPASLIGMTGAGGASRPEIGDPFARPIPGDPKRWSNRRDPPEIRRASGTDPPRLRAMGPAV